MDTYKVAFLIITTNGDKLFEINGGFEQQKDILNIINRSNPIAWFDKTSNRKMYRYDDVMIDILDDFANKYGSKDNNTPYELRKFMKRLDKDEPYYMFRMEHELVNVSQIQIAQAVYQLVAIKNGLNKDNLWNKVKDNITSLFNDYSIQTIGYEDCRVGDDSGERVCRFCGKTKAEGAFFDKDANNKRVRAHAISEALGNKTLFCSEECCECNKRLSAIEDSLSIGYLEIRRSLCWIHGKNGINSVEGQNFIMDAKNGRIVLSDNAHIEDKGNKIHVRLEGREVFTFQDIYKALVKFVIDLVDKKELPHFHNTINWINGTSYPAVIPPIKQFYCDNVYEQPIIEIFIRKPLRGIDAGPYCFANLYVCDLCFQYVIPFVDVDCGKMQSLKQLLPFVKKMDSTLSIYKWNYEWINGEDTIPRTAWVDIEYSKTNKKELTKDFKINNNLKMMPPKWETKNG